MITIIYIIATAVIFWKLGRRYQDFQDLMLARRVSKIVMQREQFEKDHSDYERFEAIEKRMKKVRDAADQDGELA